MDNPQEPVPGPERHRGLIAAEVEPIDPDGIRSVTVGGALWLLAFVALLPFYGRLQDSGRGWWLWTCLCGVGLALIGLESCRRRKRAHDE